jgi:hypothetical protein
MIQAEVNIRVKDDGHWNIPNPVDPRENFADRWHENNNAKQSLSFNGSTGLLKTWDCYLGQGKREKSSPHRYRHSVQMSSERCTEIWIKSSNGCTKNRTCEQAIL